MNDDLLKRKREAEEGDGQLCRATATNLFCIER
jgi:hypothetical protein